MILVTGGAGFIGANFIRDWLAISDEPVLNLDKLIYAGNPESLDIYGSDERYLFTRADIGEQELVGRLLYTHQPRAIINFAAESHVDRSISSPDTFIQTNVVGTFRLLTAATHYWNELGKAEASKFRFLHVSTDEVYGSLEIEDPAFTECNLYQPNSAYSASKASGDHFVRAWFHTYGLPVLTTNCSNNYRPYQLPEKLIPLVITRALAGKELPIYGDGKQIRDWLYFKDHCSAIRLVLDGGTVGDTYNIGGENERENTVIVGAICDLLDKLQPKKDRHSYHEQITFVTDRLGHDRRYAIDASKLRRELGWEPAENFDSGIYKTVRWYLYNRAWTDNIKSGQYRTSGELQMDSQRG